MIVCGACYDDGLAELKWSSILGILPRQECKLCGRPCLGYSVRVPGAASDAPEVKEEVKPKRNKGRVHTEL
jgi:hypothetical protein